MGVQYGHRFIHVIDPSPVKNRQAFDVASCAALQLGFKWKKKKEYLKFSNLIKKETKTVYDCGNAQPSSISSINELSYRDENPTKIETSYLAYGTQRERRPKFGARVLVAATRRGG